jgi:hypothetical protein
MVAFGEWKEAHNEAVRLARMLGREVGILKGKEFGRQVFEVIHLPKAENRYKRATAWERIASGTSPARSASVWKCCSRRATREEKTNELAYSAWHRSANDVGTLARYDDRRAGRRPSGKPP